MPFVVGVADSSFLTAGDDSQLARLRDESWKKQVILHQLDAID
jgi:hypothetical protein